LGDRVYWQDSGFYLTCVKECTALYPPGFILYLLLCKAWTLALGFVDFTRAVHLFSAACAAGAAGVMGLAARDFLRARTGVLKVHEGEPGALEEACGAGVGVLTASGFTFWFAGTYAKGYALLYLVLALLLWRMIVAAERRRPRDFTIVAVLIGLAWQAHPSATGAGLALLLFVGAHAKLLGWKGLAWRTGAAAAAALGPALLLPWLTSGDGGMGFGEPRSVGEIARYVAGATFTHRPGAFGFQADRWGTAAMYFWEEFLGVGVVLLIAGAIRLWRANPRALGGAALWAVPFTALPTIFILEGQQDHWYVAAWLPLQLLAGLGLHDLARRAGTRAVPVAAGVAALGLAWAALANRGDLDQRSYDLAEIYGRVLLEPLAKDALVIATSDETSAIGHYLGSVRGARPDVIVVRRGYLGAGWYDQRLLKRDPRLKAPDYAAMHARFPRATVAAARTAAFAAANVSPERPVYFERPPPFEMLPEGYDVVPAGPLLKLVPRGLGAVDSRYWAFPIEPEAVAARVRRPRGQSIEEGPGWIRSKPQAYERRLLLALVRAKFLLADWHYRRGEMGPARELFEAVLRADPETGALEEVVLPLGLASARVGAHERAEAVLKHLLNLPGAGPDSRIQAWATLGDLAARAGRNEEARECWRRALATPGQMDPGLRATLNRRLGR
ncbi:MAG TPA: DUF2723 domain-containing protein, partial [Planctomycetota bacterium]